MMPFDLKMEIQKNSKKVSYGLLRVHSKDIVTFDHYWYQLDLKNQFRK